MEDIPGEPQFNAFINACDVIFTGYLNFKGSSNLLTKAAYFNKPVIASEGFCMGKRVEKYHTGIVIKQDDIPGVYSCDRKTCYN